MIEEENHKSKRWTTIKIDEVYNYTAQYCRDYPTALEWSPNIPVIIGIESPSKKAFNRPIQHSSKMPPKAVKGEYIETVH